MAIYTSEWVIMAIYTIELWVYILVSDYGYIYYWVIMAKIY